VRNEPSSPFISPLFPLSGSLMQLGDLWGSVSSPSKVCGSISVIFYSSDTQIRPLCVNDMLHGPAMLICLKLSVLGGLALNQPVSAAGQYEAHNVIYITLRVMRLSVCHVTVSTKLTVQPWQSTNTPLTPTPSRSD